MSWLDLLAMTDPLLLLIFLSGEAELFSDFFLLFINLSPKVY
jgi:hypothetical protein